MKKLLLIILIVGGLAMAKDKVYTPEVIQDTPFPQDSESVISAEPSGESSTKSTYKPTSIKDSGFLRRTIARETLSQSLNTKTKRITDEFQFSSQGAIQIGNYQEGITGDIRLSPNGITARDQAGIDSFALDATTGNATFRGIVQASDFQIVGGGIIGVTIEGMRSQGGFDNIQEAIEWIHSYGGGTVYLPIGTYDVESDVTLYSNIKIVGEDSDNTIMSFGGTDAQFIGLGTSSNYKTNIELINLQFQGRRTSIRSGAIRLSYASDIRIINCYFTDNYNSGSGWGDDIHLDDYSKRVLIDSSRFISSGIGVDTNAQDSIISNSYFYDAQSYAIDINGGIRLRIVQNSFEACTSSAIYSSGDINRIIISNNNIDDHRSSGIYMGNTSEAHYVTITGNVLSGGSGSTDAIFMGTQSLKSTIVSNVIRNWGSDGIELDGNAFGINVTGNSITDNTGYGVQTGDGVGGGANVVSNILSSNTAGAYNTRGSDIIEHNMS